MVKKEVDVISKKINNLDKTLNTGIFIGKNVYSKTGENLGIVYDVVLKRNSMVGILVKGKRKQFFGKELFESESDKAIVLNIEPVTSIIGKFVFDSLGKKIGKVSGLTRKTGANNYSELLVKKSVYRKAFAIPKKQVSIAKKNVILNKPYDD